MKRIASSEAIGIGMTVVVAAVLSMLSTAPLTADGERRARVSRPQPQVSSPSAPSDSGSRSATRARSSRSSGKAAVTRSSHGRSGGGGHRHYRHYGRYPRYSIGLGYWGYWGPYAYGHYYPYYPLFPSLYYGPYPAVPAAYGLGAVDVNVKPKKTELWVDGQFVGLTGKFDGFPGYLWLSKGRHELIFHHPGFSTEVREIRVLEGVVVKLHLRLEEGETVPPEELTKVAAGRQRAPVRPERAPVDRSPRSRERAAPSAEPGRLQLTIEPDDASIYLDGRFLGTAGELARLHAGLLVEAGPHTLEVVRPGHEGERFELTVEPGEEKEVALRLSQH